MVRLRFGDGLQPAGDVLVALDPGRLREIRVHSRELVSLARYGRFQVLDGRLPRRIYIGFPYRRDPGLDLYLAEVFARRGLELVDHLHEPFCMLVLVHGRDLEYLRDLLVPLLPGRARIERIPVPGLAFADERL